MILWSVNDQWFPRSQQILWFEHDFCHYSILYGYYWPGAWSRTISKVDWYLLRGEYLSWIYWKVKKKFGSKKRRIENTSSKCDKFNFVDWNFRNGSFTSSVKVDRDVERNLVCRKASAWYPTRSLAALIKPDCNGGLSAEKSFRRAKPGCSIVDEVKSTDFRSVERGHRASLKRAE